MNFTFCWPWQKARIDEENKIVTEYGFKNKREIWKMNSILGKFKVLSKRLIAAAALSPPTNLRAKETGAKVLIDMAQAGVYFPHMVFFTRRSYLRAERQSALNFLKGYADGLERMASDRVLAKKVIQKYIREKNDEVLETTYQYGLDYIVRLPYPAKEGIAEVLRQSEHPKAKNATPDDFVDLSLTKSLETQGFFARR